MENKYSEEGIDFFQEDGGMYYILRGHTKRNIGDQNQITKKSQREMKLQRVK